MCSNGLIRNIMLFTFAALTSAAAQGQIRITEYYYQNGEYVELTNVGGAAIDMTGWSFDDDSGVPGSFDISDFGIVAPGESVIITQSNATDFRTAWNLAPTVKVIGGSGTAAGLNRNDSLIIYDASDVVVDRLDYGDQTFPGSIRAENPSGWICAEGLGANDPYLWVLSAVSDSQNSFTSTTSIVGSPGTFVSVPCPLGACCTAGACTDGVTELDCQNGGGTYQGDGTDCDGTTCPPISSAPVRITEYMYQGANGEFIELSNMGVDPVDMTGWSMDDSDNAPGSVMLSGFGIVAAGESVIITDAVAEDFRTAWGLAGGVKIIGGSGGAAALGRNDAINVWDASNGLVDRLAYGDEAFPGSIRTQNRSGWVCQTGIGANDPHAWVLSSIGDAQSSVQSTGSDIGNPGVFVSIDCADGPTILSTIPAKQTAAASLPSVSVTFSTSVTGVAAANLSVGGSAATGVTGSGAGPYVFTGFAAPPTGSVTIVMTSGSIISTPDGIPFTGDTWTVAVGFSIVINEIHYHPDDTLDPTQTSEFLEFYNNGPATVDMSGWTTSGVVITFPPATTIDPGEYLVIATNPTELQARTGHAGALQWTSGALANGGEAVTITDTAGNVIDTVSYSDGGAWPSSPDGGGPSLELINPGLPNQYSGAWRPSLVTYGTPGQQNSTFVAEPAPLIALPMHSPSIPAPSTPVVVTATVLDNGVTPPVVTLHFRQDAASPGAYSSIQMLDDGASGDGAAGDNVYGASLAGLANGEQYDFYITADDGNSVSTYPTNHFSANGACSTTGCQMDETPSCVLCQTLLVKFSSESIPTDFPVYHILVTRPNKNHQESRSCNTSATAFDPCKTEYDATFVDDTGKVYYNVTERYRGQSSITLFPKSYAVDFPSSNQLQLPMGWSTRRLILNGNNPTRQKLGFDIFGDAGLPTSRCEFVRLRYTGINYDTTNIGSNGFNGLYACIERVDSDMLDSQDGAVTPDRGLTSDGNLYRGENTANFDWRGTDPGPYRVNMWGRNGYAKENNEELDSWTDLISLLDAMNNSPAGDYASNVSALMNEDLCARYFAIHNILANKEGGIYRDTGDDYFLYMNPPGHENGSDAIFITWDTDSVLRDSNTDTIWRTGNQNNTIATIRNFLRHNAFAPIFVKEISDLVNTGILSQANFDARIDAMPNQAFFNTGSGATVPTSKQDYKNWYATRRNFINNEIIDALTLTGVPSSPYTDPNPVIAIGGQLNQAGTHNVTVNGQQATFSVFAGTWSHNVTLWPGINKISVKAFDRDGGEFESLSTTVLYDPPAAAPGLRLTMPNRMVDSKTLTIKAEILDDFSNIQWRTCTQVGTVSAVRLSDNSPVPTSVTVFETLSGGAGSGGPAADSIRFYNGVGSVSITLDAGAATPPGDILVTVTVGSFSATRLVEVLDGEAPGLYKNLSGTLAGADLTWSPNDGVIHLTGNVTVSSGTLTILPDTLIMVDAGANGAGTAVFAQSGGTINASGTRTQPICFFPTAAAAAMVLPQGMNERNNFSSWRGIYVQNTGSSTFNHVFITGAGNGEVVSHPRAPIVHIANSHSVTMHDCVFADCPGMAMQAIGGASGTYTLRRCLMSRVGIGGEFLGTGSTLLIEDSWFTRIGRAPEPNNIDGDVLHLDRPGNSYTVRRSILTDCGDDMVDHSTGAQPIIENCIIYDCRDKVISIGELAQGPEATITMLNCLMFNAPGGIRCNGAPAFLTNCTLGSNTNVNGQSCASVIQECILWTNSADTCCGTVDYTIVGNAGHLGCGTGNLSTNPQFVSTSCNYNLQAGSPALTAGPGGTQIGWLGFPIPSGGCQNNGDCDDSNACTTDLCDGNGFCSNTPLPNCTPCDIPEDCNDGNACTADSCVGGQCSNTPIPDCTPCMDAGDCDDSDLCTADTCEAGVCVNTPPTCPPNQTCNPASGDCELLPITVTFQQGMSGYTGTVDTYIDAALGSQATATPIVIDGTPVQQALLRFDNIFGDGPGQIPAGATISSATLTLWTGTGANDQSPNPVNFHVLLNTWVDTGVWANYGVAPWNATGGIQADGVDALAAIAATTTIATAPTAANINVTTSLEAWMAAPATNFGWAILPTGNDGLRLESSESTTSSGTRRPMLSVTYIPSGCANDPDCDDGNPCTDDACVDSACQYTNNTETCDDGDPCTNGDICSSGACTGTPIPNCCESDVDCNDNDACNGVETCQGGTCQPGTPLDCDDGLACTDDSCSPGSGCVNVSNCPPGEVCNMTTGDCEAPSSPPLPIAAGATWKYFKGTAEPTTPIASLLWTQIGFDDSTWLEGPSGFGYGTDCDPYGTVLSDMQNATAPPGYVSIYTRIEFSISNPAAMSTLELTLDYDDAYVAYINGVEVARSNVVGTPPTFSQLATADHECSAAPTPNPADTILIHNSFDLATLLVSGTNVLAIQAHNLTANSSDFTLLATMDGTSVGCQNSIDCDDGNPCTTDVCNNEVCEYTNNTDACDDGNLCTTGDVCGGGTCAGTPVSCPPGETCNPSNGDCELTPVTVTFQEGVNSYAGTHDTFLHENAPGTINGSAVLWEWDNDEPSSSGLWTVGLIRFDNIFGNGAGQIPVGSTITSATLSIVVTNPSAGTASSLNNCLAAWDEATATWTSFGGDPGVAGATGSFVANAPTATGTGVMTVTSSLAAWSASPSSNNGWIVIPLHTDGVEAHSSEATTPANRPLLTVTYVAGAECNDNGDCDDGNPCTTDICNNDVCEYTNNADACDDGNLCTTGDVCGGGTCAGTPVSCPPGETCNPSNGQCEELPGPGLSVCESFESGFTLGQPISSHPDWFSGANAPVVNGGIGVAGSTGLAPSPDIFTWVSEGFNWNDFDFASITLQMDFQTGSAGGLDDDRVGWMIVNNSTDSDFIFGVQVDLVSGNLRLEGYWDNQIGVITDRRPLFAQIAGGLNASTFYRLRAEITKLTATSARIDASLTLLDAQGDPSGPPVLSGTILDTSALGADSPDPAYFTPTMLWPAFKNHNTAATAGAADNACYEITTTDPGCTSDGECDDGVFCNGVETCNTGTGDCVPGPGDPCQPGEFCNEDTDACDECQIDAHCDDNDVCDGVETCVAGACVAGTPLDCDDGNACTLDECDPIDGCTNTLVCTPTVTAVGPRYLAITPPADQASVALRVENPSLLCTPKYVDADGYLTLTPVFQSSAAWGTVFVADREIIPSTEYTVVADIRLPEDPENLTPGVMATTWAWGNVNDTGNVDIFDIVCVLDGFQDIFTSCALEAVDLMGQTPSRTVDIFDIVAVLDAFQDIPYPDPNPCAMFLMSDDPKTWQPGVLTLQPSATILAPRERVTVQVMASDLSDLRGYELAVSISGGRQGALILESIQVSEARGDYVFAGLSAHHVSHTTQGKMANALVLGSVALPEPRYLVTLTFMASANALGQFTIDLDTTAAGTTLVDGSGQAISGWSSQPAVVQVRQSATPQQKTVPAARQ